MNLSLNGNDETQQKKTVARHARSVRASTKKVVTGLKKFQIKTMFASLKKGFFSAIRFSYRFCYATGVQTIRFTRFVAKRAVRFLAPVGRLLYKGLDFVLLRHVRIIWTEMRRFGQGFGLAFSSVRAAYERHPLLSIPQVLLLPVLAVRRHRRALASLFNMAAPVAAAFVLAFTVHYWSNVTFALALEYDGEELGFIADESVFDAAATMATERVINTDNSFAVERVPKLTIAVAPKSEILDETAVCDKILRSSSDSIAEVSGLYIDGKFEGALQSRTELDNLLNGILQSYSDGSENERAEFIQDVQVIDGLYPIASIRSAEEMQAYLTAQTMVEKYYTVVAGDSPIRVARAFDMTLDELRALNPQMEGEKILIGEQLLLQRAQPFLRVQVVRTVTYEETIPYTTKKVQDTKQYIGYEAVKTKGVDGVQSVTAEVVLVDGLEQSRTVLSTEVIKEPVERVLVVGAKKINPNASAGDGISTGRFIWPVPGYSLIYSNYGETSGRSKPHAGIDIAGGNIYGKSIVAADGGTVVEVGSHWSYGKYVLIDHGGGYRTLYAHCSSLLVKAGQKVGQGEVIAKVGSTGYSTGPHLHFEVRVNGRTQNPNSYVHP